MPGFFFDSSALVKLYHPELGSPVVDRIVHSAGNRIVISRLASAEVTSAFAIQVRTQAIGHEDAAAFQRRYRRDIMSGKLEVFSVTESEFAVTERLLDQYAFDLKLRTLDALQLAVALEVRSQGLIEHFVAADRILCDAAAREGFSVINPEIE